VPGSSGRERTPNAGSREKETGGSWYHTELGCKRWQVERPVGKSRIVSTPFPIIRKGIKGTKVPIDSLRICVYLNIPVYVTGSLPLS
jgi:hypothetical protein